MILTLKRTLNESNILGNYYSYYPDDDDDDISWDDDTVLVEDY